MYYLCSDCVLFVHYTLSACQGVSSCQLLRMILLVLGAMCLTESLQRMPWRIHLRLCLFNPLVYAPAPRSTTMESPRKRVASMVLCEIMHVLINILLWCTVLSLARWVLVQARRRRGMPTRGPGRMDTRKCRFTYLQARTYVRACEVAQPRCEWQRCVSASGHWAHPFGKGIAHVCPWDWRPRLQDNYLSSRGSLERFHRGAVAPSWLQIHCGQCLHRPRSTAYVAWASCFPFPFPSSHRCFGGSCRCPNEV